MALYVVGFQPHYFDAPWIEGFGELALLFRRISVQLCVKPLPVSFFFCIIPCQVSTVRLPCKRPSSLGWTWLSWSFLLCIILSDRLVLPWLEPLYTTVERMYSWIGCFTHRRLWPSWIDLLDVELAWLLPWVHWIGVMGSSSPWFSSVKATNLGVMSFLYAFMSGIDSRTIASWRCLALP